MNNDPIPSSPNQTLPQTAPLQIATISSKRLIMLQWLTYASWGGTALLTCSLFNIVVANLLYDSTSHTFTLYILGATVALLILAIICDTRYQKYEPEEKTGGASVVMVFHGALFAILCIGAVGTVISSIVANIANSEDPRTSELGMYSASAVLILFAILFLRTLYPYRIPYLRTFLINFMSLIVALTGVFAIIGPVADELATRDDRLIENNAYAVTDAIDKYAKKNNRLPATLKDITLDGDAKELVDTQVLRYTPDTLPATAPPYSSAGYERYPTFFYEICATFTHAKDSDYSRSNASYESYVRTSSHDAGENCYRVRTSPY